VGAAGIAACPKTRLVLGKALEKTVKKPGFSSESKGTAPKTEVLERPYITILTAGKAAGAKRAKEFFK
jgi:hypothetical protein